MIFIMCYGVLAKNVVGVGLTVEQVSDALRIVGFSGMKFVE